ncbi:MAG: class I SAM-dependent methyltransferase [bacterium]|nr:class I SAM-dependent methyltransferase [bacterium]
MEQTFGAAYSGAFDTLYQDKDYNAEVELLETAFQQHSDHPIKTVLDLGCGTGNHAIRLARRGYRVLGVDRSDQMLAAAWVKAGSLPPLTEINFFHGDLRTVRLEQRFDAVVMLFGVLGYQTQNEDVAAAFASARAHLNPGGLLAFDVWYGPAVLEQRPSDRLKDLRFGDTRLIRLGSASLDTLNQTCRVEYRIWRLEGAQLAGETHEVHTVRYFFAQELRYFLSQAGFELVRLTGFPNIEHAPDESTWNVIGVARGV